MAAIPVLPKLVGERVKRREDPRLIQGLGTYVDDLKVTGMLHLAGIPYTTCVAYRCCGRRSACAA